MVTSRRMDSVKYVVDEERVINRVLPRKAGCRFSKFVHNNDNFALFFEPKKSTRMSRFFGTDGPYWVVHKNLDMQ